MYQNVDSGLIFDPVTQERLDIFVSQLVFAFREAGYETICSCDGHDGLPMYVGLNVTEQEACRLARELERLVREQQTRFLYCDEEIKEQFVALDRIEVFNRNFLAFYPKETPLFDTYGPPSQPKEVWLQWNRAAMVAQLCVAIKSL